MRIRSAFLAFAASFACAAFCVAPIAALAANDTAAKVHAAVDATIKALMAQQDIAGMAVAVTMNGENFVFNYGLASKENQTPVDDHTLFEIGSVSKTLTATLAGYALATGHLALSDHPDRFVPAVRGRPIDRATLLHLATYTAGGLPLQFPDAVDASDSSALAYLRNWQPSAKPGVERQYSNISIGFLGYITGLCLHDGYAKAMETQIFAGLGMTHTYLHIPPEVAPFYAWGYREGRPVHVNPGPFDLETYGVKTSAEDMLRFVQLNIDPSGLDPVLKHAVEATHVGYFRAGAMVQGLGWEQYAWPVSRERLLGGNASEMIENANPVIAIAPRSWSGPRLFNKTGSTGGFAAYVLFIPSQKFGIVMLANKNYPIPARVEAAYAILDALLSDNS